MNTQNLSLIQQAAKGDQQAFQTLIEQQQGLIYSLCYRMLGNSAEAEDATQEVFVKLWKNLNAYQSENKLSTWLYKIASNYCLDKLKKEKVKRLYMDRQSTHEPENSTVNETIFTELSQAIQTLSGKLPAKQRMVFVLAVMEHQSIAEIAEVTNMNKGQVKSNLYYARQQMSAMLKKYYGEKQKSETDEL